MGCHLFCTPHYLPFFGWILCSRFWLTVLGNVGYWIGVCERPISFFGILWILISEINEAKKLLIELQNADSVQFSPVQSIDHWGHRGDMRDDSAEILFQSFQRGGLHKQFWHGQGCPLFDVIHPAFPLPAMALTLSKMLWRMVLEGLLQRMLCLNHASFCLLIVAS